MRLRDWLGLTRDEFYDPTFVALMPIGLCYLGTGATGDLPPRPECAPLWHPQMMPFFAKDRLTVIIGAYHSSVTSQTAAHRSPTPWHGGPSTSPTQS